MPTRDSAGARKLRQLRKGAGLTLSDVERLTWELAAMRRNPRLLVPKSWLCEIETAKRTLGIHFLYALARAYGCDLQKLMEFYGLKAEG